MSAPDVRTNWNPPTPKCSICGVIYRLATQDGYAREGPIAGACLGCFIFTTEMRMWLVRGGGHEPMGDWTSGWLKEILSNPGKHRDA